MSTSAQNTQPVTEEPPLLGGKEHVENMSKTLGHILDVLKGSTIAEEGGNDVRSKFWTTYKKVSDEYDGDFLDRATDDMAIILTFAGLFSAVNSTFIIGMRPDPGDTTNALMVQLIQVIANGPDAVNITNLSSSSTYPSSIVWTQTLSYASLAFSLLAAFGAVMGKQWINSYKTTRGRGSLEERGLERQNKLEGLEYWRMQTILGALFVLLQISLLLFGLSLSANMFRQSIATSSVIIGTTAFGMIFYMGTIFVSVLSPYSPFQSPGSKILGTIFNLPVRSTSPEDSWHAIRWILETSTNPDFVSAAADMIPQVYWPKDVDVGAICGRLHDTFTACGDKLECVKGIAHFWAQSVGINRNNIHIGSRVRNRLIRDAFTAGRHAWEQSVTPEETDTQQRQRHKADACTALRTMMVYTGQKQSGREHWKLPLPDDKDLIWDGDLEWCRNDGQPPSCEEFDWLIDYLTKMEPADDETASDALTALSTMHGLGTSGKRGSCIISLVRFMNSEIPRVRKAALRAIIQAEEDLISITSKTMLLGVHPSLLDSLSHALFTVALDNPFHHDEVSRCLRLIFSLAANNEWRERLPGYAERCFSLVDPTLSHPDISFYLAGIFLRIDPSGTNLSLNPYRVRRLELIIKAWDRLGYLDLCTQDNHGCIDFVPALVEATRRMFPDLDNGLPSSERRVTQSLAREVEFCLGLWRRTVGEADQSPINGVLPAVQSLHDDLELIRLR